ncbi:MAG: hypothetical protein ACLFO1_01075 [Spirochaetaceae bacterium]
MQVLVNEQQVDIQLEDERTLGEVIQGIRNWLQDMNLYITDLSVNHTLHHLDAEQAWAGRNIEEVDKIEIVALPPWEVRLNGYRILHNYVATLADLLEEPAYQEARELLAEYPYVRRHLSEIITAVLGGASENSLDSAVRRAAALVDASPGGASDEGEAAESAATDAAQDDAGPGKTTDTLRRIGTVLNTRIRELATPFREARKTEQALRTLMPELEEVSILLQTGEEQKAMSLIVQFSELVERLLRVLVAVDSRYGGTAGAPRQASAPLRQLTDSLQSTLEELVAAFNDMDTVLIGDLLEYDMLPRVEKLLELIPDADSPESA